MTAGEDPIAVGPYEPTAGNLAPFGIDSPPGSEHAPALAAMTVVPCSNDVLHISF